MPVLDDRSTPTVTVAVPVPTPAGTGRTTAPRSWQAAPQPAPQAQPPVRPPQPAARAFIFPWAASKPRGPTPPQQRMSRLRRFLRTARRQRYDRPTAVEDEHDTTARDLVSRSPGLTADHHRVYGAALAGALRKMSSGSRAAALAAVRGGSATFHPDHTGVGREYIRGIGGKPPPGLVGFVAHTPGDDRVHLHLDGIDDPDRLEGVYLHELGHAVDAGRRHSHDPKWQRIWKHEIFNGRHLLSRYARESPTEGFAEFHRVISEKGAGATAARFPKAVAYLKSHGLVD